VLLDIRRRRLPPSIDGKEPRIKCALSVLSHAIYHHGAELMRLDKCRACGKVLNIVAPDGKYQWNTQCPHCGSNDPYRSSQSLKTVVLVFLLITLVLIGSRYFRY
jgi:predicted RNA-binding Zn-ribbon protein involved in translation (DUF1610 family)